MPKTILNTVALLSAAMMAASPSYAGMTTLYDGPFARHPAKAQAAGRTVAEHCQVGGETSPDNWSNASAHLTLMQDAAASQVIVTVENARPNTLYTIWLMLSGKTPGGEKYGGNPIMKSGATALVPTSDLAEAVRIMKAPKSKARNGFTTDARGSGSVTVDLDFPIVGGAYPFQHFAGFDANDPAFTHETPSAVPVAITGKSAGAPFTLRLASHCGDNMHNGLVAGRHEAWFNWLAD